MLCGPALPPDTGPGIGVTCFEFARSGGPMSVNPHIFRLTELHRRLDDAVRREARRRGGDPFRSEEHTSELQSLMRISYAVFCLKKKKTKHTANLTSFTNTR